jgi:hypothetical protein
LPSADRARTRLVTGTSSKGAVIKRIATLLVCLAFLGALSLAQNAPEQPGTGSRMSQDQTPGTGMMGMHHKHDMSKMHEQMMKDMQADSDSMRFNLQKMKDQIGKVSDRGTRDQLQLNIDMWQSLIDHMDKHMDAMKKMMGAHKGPPDDAGKHEHHQSSSEPHQKQMSALRTLALGFDQYNDGARLNSTIQAG